MRRAALFALVSIFLIEGAARGFGNDDGKTRRQKKVRINGGASKFVDTLVRRVAADLSMVPNPGETESWSVTTINRPPAASVRTRRSHLTGLHGGRQGRNVQQAVAQHFMEQVFGPGELRIGNVLKLGEGTSGFAHVLWAPRGGTNKRWKLLTEVSYGLVGGGKQRTLKTGLLWRTGEGLSEWEQKNPKIAAKVKANQKHIPRTRNDVQRYLGQELLAALQAEAGTAGGAVKETGGRGKQAWVVQPKGLRGWLSRPSLLHALQARLQTMDAQDPKLAQVGLQGQAYRAAIFQPVAKRAPESRFPVAAKAGVKGGYETLELAWTDGGQRHQLRVAGGRATYDVDPL